VTDREPTVATLMNVVEIGWGPWVTVADGGKETTA